MSLRGKLLAGFLAAAIVPLAFMSTLMYALSAGSVEASFRQFASLYAAEVTLSLDGFERDYELITRSVLAEPQIIRVLESEEPAGMDERIERQTTVREFLTRLTAIYPAVRTVTLMSAAPDGAPARVYSWCADPDGINETALLARPWLRNAVDSPSPFFVTPVHDRSYYKNNKDGVMITVGRTLWNYGGMKTGVILFDLSPAQLIKLSGEFLALGTENDIRVTVTTAAGETVYDSDAVTGKRPWVPGHGNDAADDAAGGGVIVLRDVSASGRLAAGVEIPRERLLERLRRVRILVAAFSLLWLGIIALFAARYSERITSPLWDLKRGMRQVENGNYAAAAGVIAAGGATASGARGGVAGDEIVELTRSYHTMVARIQTLIEDVYLADIKGKQARLQALQGQINPHMLYNTLESIRMKAVVNNQDEIAEMIKTLARMFKYSLALSGGSIADELRYARDYLYLQNVRYDHVFVLEERLPPRVRRAAIIPMVLQPIIENSVKHGFRGRGRVLRILITAEPLPPAKARISVVDDGLGCSGEKLAEIRAGRAGIGLKNLSERLTLRYGGGLTVSALDGLWFRVEFTLPLEDA